MPVGRRKPFRFWKKQFDSIPLARRLSMVISASHSDSLDDLKKRLCFIKSQSSVLRKIFGFMRTWRLIYIMMGRDEEARAEAAEVLRINPKFSVEWFAKTTLFKERSVVDKYIDAMRKAGLPDKPPPAQP